jgi:hypothetical protein
VETKSMGKLRRRGFQASKDHRCAQARCPICFMIRDALPKGFTCALSYCPRVFINIQPPNGSQPAVRVEG